MTDATHASFFSGVGGLDLGLERAGWRTVSFSEIDPYASAVLAERWPGVPNLGDIVRLAERLSLRVGRVDGRDASPVGDEGAGSADGARDLDPGSRRRGAGGGRVVGSGTEPSGGERRIEPWAYGADWTRAELWTGGFPCQDLSVAGKRRGMGAGTRSGLAWSFLDLVERHRPPAVLLENVPGLLSSNAGRDFGTLLATLGKLGYGWAYRVLDARYFGVPQRRRRVFILGLHARVDPSGEGAAAVLSVGTRCPGHPATGHEAGEEPADRARPGVDIARTVVGTAGKRHDEDIDTPDLIGTLREHVRPGSNTDHTIIGPSPDPDGVRAADGLARGSHDRDGLAYVNALDQRRGGADDNEAQAGQLVTAFVKHRAAGQFDSSPESWGAADVSGTLDAISHIPRTRTAILSGAPLDDPLLPLGLDSHRYRCCGNGVVADVAEFIGARLLAAIERDAA